MTTNPVTREEMYLAKAAGQNVETPVPITRKEMFLNKVAEAFSGGGGGGSGGLPTGGAPHQQLVTDKDGNAKWEDRPFYSEQMQGEVLPETELVSMDEGQHALVTPYTRMPVAGVNHTVVYNGVSYECVGEKFEERDDEGNIVMEAVALGNIGVMNGGTSTDEPFVFVVFTPETAAEQGVYGVCLDLLGSETATISINLNGEYTKKIDSKYIEIPDDPEDDQTPFVVTVKLSGAFENAGSGGYRDDLVYLSHTENEVINVFENTNRPIFCHVITKVNGLDTYKKHYILPLVHYDEVNKNSAALSPIEFECYASFGDSAMKCYKLTYNASGDGVRTFAEKRLWADELYASKEIRIMENGGLVLSSPNYVTYSIHVSDDGELTTERIYD